MANPQRTYSREFKLSAVKLITEQDYSVAVTANHPIWGPEGWVRAGSRKVGDRMAVMSHWDRWPAHEQLRGEVRHGPGARPRMCPVEFAVTEELGRLLGYMTTDGSNRPKQSIKFTHTRPAFLAEVPVASIAPTIKPFVDSYTAAGHPSIVKGRKLLLGNTAKRLQPATSD